MTRADCWPAALILARHGESAGNVARDLAEGSGAEVIDIDVRDMDVDLSPLGCRQAQALGSWLGGLGDEAPTTVVASPYRRARHTAELAVEAGRLDVEVLADERLREREFGVLDRLTIAGIRTRFPAEASARSHLGKFFHRPAGGESWADVGLRVRSALETLCREHANERVLVVAHQVVIYMFRYVLERLSEEEIIAISRAQELGNCSLTTFVHDPAAGRRGGMVLRRFNEPVALTEAGTRSTAEDDPVPGGQG